MSEREKMYSAILHREVEINGEKLVRIATLLELNYNKAYKLMKGYKPLFDRENDAMTLAEIIRMRNKCKKIMYKSRKEAQEAVERFKRADRAEFVFHMPITKRERNEYNAIAELVLKDEYLPKGYRKKYRESTNS